MKMQLKYIVTLCSISLLVSCASPQKVKHYDRAENVSNNNYQKVKIEYVPVALPGQLMPVPNANEVLKNKHKKVTKEKAVQEANKLAQEYPTSADFFNAIMNYPYMQGTVYTIYTAPLNITDIVLERGEKLISQAAGDTSRWQIAQTYSGEDDDIQQHILIKPNVPDITNSLLITTNKRSYHLILKAVNPESYMVSVKWTYPNENDVMFGDPNMPYSQGSSDNSMVLMSDNLNNNGIPNIGDSCPRIDLNDMHSDYGWKMLEGNKPEWIPQEVFSDGEKSYIKFSNYFIKSNSELPILEIGQADGTYSTMKNYRFQCGYLITDEVLENARLISGVKSQKNLTVLEIKSEK